MLNNRETQLLHEFTFFGEPEARAPSHIYELRTYHLKVKDLLQRRLFFQKQNPFFFFVHLLAVEN